MAAGSKRSSTWAPSLNTVVFTPDWKSNDTAFGSGGERAGQGLLGRLVPEVHPRHARHLRPTCGRGRKAPLAASAVRPLQATQPPTGLRQRGARIGRLVLRS